MHVVYIVQIRLEVTYISSHYSNYSVEMDHLPHENVMLIVQEEMQMTLFDFLSGKEDVDIDTVTSKCVEYLNSVDMKFIHRGQLRLKELLKCLRRINIEHLEYNGQLDPLFPQSSSPNVCNIQ